MICYIPTKNRKHTKTYKLFEKAGIECKHFIEPKEFQDYDMGVTYVRNFMLDYAKKNNEEWVIFCDDDVSAFGIYKNKTINIGASIWFDILKKAKKLPFELIGINYTQFAWSENKSYSINSKFAEVCVLINVKKINWRYTEFTKEDRDFQLQTIQNGYGVLRFNHYWFSCPSIGTNKGGLYDLYKEKKDTIWAGNIVKKWYPFAKLIRKKGKIDAKVDIKSFAKSLNKEVR